ncbi:MFS transporter [Candidatus Latescibacterota bacterium]
MNTDIKKKGEAHTPGGHRQNLPLDNSLLIIFGVTLTAVMGVSSITPAFPRIVQELSIPVRDIGLLITVFTIPGVFLTPVLGVFADRFGRKKILVPSLLLFGIAGGACGFVSNFDILLLFRFFQGIGAASLGSLNVTIIGDIYTGHERARTMGYNASVLSIGTASYPAIGGALALFGWNYPFLLPVVAVPLGFIVLWSLKNPEPEHDYRLREYFIQTWRYIQKREIVGIFIASSVTFIILYGSYITYFPLFIGHSYGSSPLTIGLIMSSASITTAITSSQLGKLVRVFSERSLLIMAFFLYAVSLVMIPLIPDLRWLAVPVITFGIAQGINIPSLQILLAGFAPMEYRAAFMSINGMVLRLGQTLGPLVMGIIFGIWGLAAPFYAGACISLVMTGVVILLIRAR